MRTKLIGTVIIALMISLASCAPAKTNTVVVNKQPKVIVVNKPRPNKKVVVVNARGRHNAVYRGRGGRVVVIR